MADVASLGIQVDSSQAAKASKDLDGLTVAATKAGKAAEATGSSAAKGATGTAQMNREVGKLASTADALGNSLSRVHPAFGLMSAGALTLATVLGGLVLGFYQLKDAAMALAERAGALKDFSETTGFTVVQLQALEKAGAQVGVSAASVGRGLERFSVAMDDVKKGVGPAYESLLEMDKGLAKQFLIVGSLSDAWDILSKAIKGSDLEQANKLARSIFGRSGVDITRLLRSSAESGGIEELVKQLKEVDRITAAQADKWDTLGDTINENMKAAKQNIASIFTETVLVGIERFSRGFLDVTRVMKDFTLGEDFKKFLEWSKTPVGMAVLAGGAGAMLGGLAAGPIGAVVGGITGAAFGGQYQRPAADGTKVQINGGQVDAAITALVAQAKALDDQKRALTASIAEQERYNSVAGAAVTPAETLRLGIDKLKLAFLEGKISADQLAKAQSGVNAQYNSQQFSTYIGLLGQAASVEEQVQQKRNAINDAARNNVRLSKDQIATQLEITRSQALGTYQLDAQIDAEKLRIQTFTTFGQSAQAYIISQTIINEQLRQGRILTAEEVAEIRAKAEALVAVRAKADQYAQIMDTLRQSGAQFGQDLVSSLRSGQSAMDAIGHAAQNLSTTLANSAITNLMSGNFVGAAVSGIGSLISGLFGNNQKKRDDQAAAAKATAERMEGYAQRAAMARIDTSTQMGELQAFDLQAQKQRLDEWRAGGRAIGALESALQAERAAIIDKWNKQSLADQEAAAAAKAQAEKESYEASLKRQQDYNDRLFATTIDTSTIGGALAAYDRQAEKDRIAEIAAGGQQIALLTATQEAERLKIYEKFNDEATKAAQDAADAQIKAAKDAADAQKKNLLAVQQYIDQVGKQARDYLNGLRTGSNSTLNPQDRLNAAQAQFNQQFALAQSGDRTALGSITQYSDTLLEAAKSFYASSAGYSNIFNDVTSKLQSIPDNLTVSQVSAADQIVAAIQEAKAATVNKIGDNTVQTLAATYAGANATTAAVYDANGQLISSSITLGSQQVGAIYGANGQLISANGTQNGYTVNAIYGSGGQVVSATVDAKRQVYDSVGALIGYTQDQTGVIYNANGQVVGAMAANQNAVAGTTYAVNTVGASNDNLTQAQSALIASQNALAAQQVAYLNTTNSLLTAIQGLNATSSGQLVELKNLQHSSMTIVSTATGISAGVDNTMISALNKIAFNTAYTWKPSGSASLFQTGVYQNGGVIPGFETGGLVGNGIWNVDSVLARYRGGGPIGLAGGEGILTAPATSAIGGAATVDFINRNRQLPSSNDNGAHFDRLGQTIARVLVATAMGHINTLREELGALRAEVRSGTAAVRDNKPRPSRPNERMAS